MINYENYQSLYEFLKLQFNPKGSLLTTMYTKNYHNLIVFNTYPSFRHHDENLKNHFHWNFVIDDDLCPNLKLCCEINVHMKDIMIQQYIILISKALNFFTIPTEGLRSITLNDNLSMKFSKYKKETILKNNFHHQSFQFFLRMWNLNKTI
jgi:hypothetical protein